MKSRWAVPGIFAMFVAIASIPTVVQGQQAAQSPQHEQHHPATTPEVPAPATEPQGNMMSMMARMKGNGAKLDELVKKMNAAKGTAKTDATAELLTALVEDRRNTCEPMMANMMSMMNMMGGRGGHGDSAPTTPQK